MHKMMAAACAAALVAGCSSGGSGSDKPGFNQLAAREAAIVEPYLPLEQNVTPVAAMPQEGRLTYDGAASVSLGNQAKPIYNSDAMGRVRMAADMGTGRVTGTISDFQERPGTQNASGRLDIDGRVAGNGLIGSTSGQLSVGGQSGAARSDLSGLFVGPRADAVVGVGRGTIGGTRPFVMVIGAER